MQSIKYFIYLNIMFILVKTEMICNTNCSNFYYLEVNQEKANEMKKELAKAKLIEFPKFIDVYVGTRVVKYCKMIYLWNSNIDKEGEKTLSPNRKEIKSWVSDEQCNVGSICDYNGDCWGSSAIECDNIDSNLNNKMEIGKKEHFMGCWEKSLFHTCTKTWYCSLIKIKKPLLLNENNVPYIIINSKKYMLKDDDENIFIDEDKTVYVETKIKSIVKTVTVECFQKIEIDERYNDAICELENEGNNLVFKIKVDSKHYNSYIGNFNNYAITIYNIREHLLAKLLVNEDGSSKPRDDELVTFSDFHALKTEVDFILNKMNYNRLHQLNDILRIKEFISGIIFSMARFNPNVLLDVLQQPLYVRVQEDKLIICPCSEEGFKFHCFYNTMGMFNSSKCSKDEKMTKIELFKKFQYDNFEITDFDPRGYGENVPQNEDERIYKYDYESKSDNNAHFGFDNIKLGIPNILSFPYTIIGFFGNLGGILYVINLINRFNYTGNV